MKLTLTTLCFFLISLAFSQENQELSPKEHHMNMLTDLQGCYQLQMIGTRQKPSIDTQLLERIKLEQKLSAETTFFYTPNIRVLILSKQSIAAGEKLDPENQIVYLNN